MPFFSSGISRKIGGETIGYTKLVCSQKERKEKPINAMVRPCEALGHALISEAPVVAHSPTSQALANKSIQLYELSSRASFTLANSSEHLFSKTGNLSD